MIYFCFVAQVRCPENKKISIVGEDVFFEEVFVQ